MKVKLTVAEKYYTDTASQSYQGTYIFMLDINKFRFSWFTDCGEWFIYIHIGSKWWRFSSCGFIKSK